MICIVLLDSIFTMGASDLALVTGPLWKFLNASNTIIGLTGSLAMTGLIGVFLSPFISVRFRYKKWYLFGSHLPYIGAWGGIGVLLLLAHSMGLSKPTVLMFVVALFGANHLFGGFVGLPHQEYIVACIPMSHRGRYTGYSYSVGAILSIFTMAIGAYVLTAVPKPMSYGILFLMTWFFCQAGYVLALFGRERPTPVEKAPRPWSKQMMAAAWNDKKFVRLIIFFSVFQSVLWPVLFIYLPQYGFRDLKMPDATSALLGTIAMVSRIGLASPIGHLTDKFSSKRAIPIWGPFVALGLIAALLFRNQWGVYVATAIGTVATVGVSAAFNPVIYGTPSPENRSGHFTFQLLLQCGAGAIGPFVGGAACDLLGYRLTFLAMTVFACLLYPMTKYGLRDLSTDPLDYE
jgi:MFS family permease